MKRWRVVTALALAGWTVSCGDPFGSDQDQLAMAEARWAAVSVDPATNTADDEFSFTVSGLRAFLTP
jgi:hypothetical protein